MPHINLYWKQKNRIDTWKIYANKRLLQIFVLFSNQSSNRIRFGSKVLSYLYPNLVASPLMGKYMVALKIQWCFST